MNRLNNYDYSQSGWYFVTICVQDRIECFGRIENGQMILNKLGRIVKKCWLETPEHFPDIQLDEWVIMPNHVHGIIVIENYGNMVGNKNFCSLQPWQTKLSRSLSSIVRGFKIGVTKWCRANNQNEFSWQKSFHDRIVRNEKSYWAIKKYIRENPLNWLTDRNNPRNFIPN